MDRGVSIAFLVEFCKAFDLWDVSIIDVQRNFIRPMTCDTHCRFVDLPIMKDNKEVVGRADTYIVYTGKSKFGDLVTSISDGADPKRKVWLDLLAFRQWQWSMANYFITIEYAIQCCPSFLVFCPDPPELSSSTIPAAVKAHVPFLRLWCLYMIYFAVMSNGVSIVVKCGHHEKKRRSSSATFFPNRAVLEALVDKIDTFSEGSVLFKSDYKLLTDKLNALSAGCADIDRMNAKLRGVVRGGVATYDDKLLHNAACGDLTAKQLILEESKKYIHKIAIAGYSSLLVEALKLKPELASSIDPDTGRTLLTSAVCGGSLDCVLFLLKNPDSNIDAKDKFDKSALSYMREFNYSDLAEYFESFYIRYKKTGLYVLPDDTNDRSVKLVLQDIDPQALYSGEKERQFLFRFVGDQLQHVQSGKYVHPIHGHKGPDVSIRLYEDSDGERTSCYPFDYDPTRCLLAGGDNFFVKVNRSKELVWHKYGNTKDDKNPFVSENGFEFEINFYVHGVNSCQAIHSETTKTDSPISVDYHQECEKVQMAGKFQELLFPRSYLIDSVVEERLPHNGKIRGIFKGGLCDKTISSDSITQRMLLITANIETFEFSFGENPWMADMTFNLSFPQLLSFRLNELEVVSNCVGEEDDKFEKLSVTLDKGHPYFDSIRVQCVLSLQNNPSNVKHICYLEVTAKNSTATLGGVKQPYNGGKWSIGEELDLESFRKLGDKVHVFAVEKVTGPLVFTGVGIDNYAGFVFQTARVDGTEDGKSLIKECFYEEDPRLTSADITHYNYFESNNKAQTGYKENGHYSNHIVRNLFRELAVEDKQVVILFQKLNYYYPEITTNPVSKVLPTMLDILAECFGDNQIGTIQSVIRVSHLKSNALMINPPVRQIWSTFSHTISMVKQFVLMRPNLNMIECAILSDDLWGKMKAILIALFQCLFFHVMAYVFIVATDNDDNEQCDFVTNAKDFYEQKTFIGMRSSILKCYWRVDFSFMMTIIAVVMTYLKVSSQIQDNYKFHVLFKPLIRGKPSLLNIILILLNCFVNVGISVLTVLLTFFVMSRCDEASELVQLSVGLTFIVELDEDFNDRGLVEIKDLVIQSFKKCLMSDMMRDSGAILEKHNGQEAKETENRSISEKLAGIIHNFILFNSTPSAACPSRYNDGFKKLDLVDQLLSADYSSVEKSTKQNPLVMKTVRSHIEEGKLLPVLNDRFGGDPHTGKPKFLVMQFKVDNADDILVSVREKLVVDFSVIETMLREKIEPNAKNGQSASTPSRLNCLRPWLSYFDPSWYFTVIVSLVVVLVVLVMIKWTATSILNGFLVVNEWQSNHAGSEVTLTWPHTHVSLSKSDLETQVNSTFSLTGSNHSSIERVIVKIHGQKNNLELISMFHFGFLPANHTIPSSIIVTNNKIYDGVCAGAVEMLSDRFWFDDVNVSQSQPFKFAGGCLLPPNQLVIQYVARQHNQTSDDDADDKGDKGTAAGGGECPSEDGSESKL